MQMNIKKLKMRKSQIAFLLFSILAFSKVQAQYFEGPEWRVPFLFEEPRKGYWTLKPWEQDPWDDTSKMHFYGSVVLQVGLDYYLESREVKNSTLWAMGGTFVLGLLKEIEDGNREGFSRRDLMCDGLGILLGVIFKFMILDRIL